MPLTTAEVATRLRVHEDTVRRYIKQGRLRAVKGPGPKGQFRVSEEALAEYVEQQTVTVESA
jgi:excisionase family DNA binding protein